MNTLKLFTVIILIALVTPCSADELELHLTSYHYSRSQDLNESNFGAGYNYQLTPTTFAVIGAFNNSYDELSVYAGAKWLPIKKMNFKAGFVAGVVTGYDDDTDANEIQPMIIPEIQFKYRDFYLSSRIIPDFGDNSSTAITFSIGFGLPDRSQQTYAAK